VIDKDGKIVAPPKVHRNRNQKSNDRLA